MSYLATTSKPIVICGAGPVGLVLAIWLKTLDPDLPVRILSNMAGPGTTTKAMGLQARTLEYYDMLGMIDQVLDAGFVGEGFQIKRRSTLLGSILYAEAGKGLTHYPYLFVLPQDKHEHLLNSHFESLGGKVEWNTEVTDFSEFNTGFNVTTRSTTSSTTTTSEASYIIGCDGARSTVRKLAHIPFEGGTYDDLLFVADIQVPTDVKPNNALNQCFDGDEFCMYIRLNDTGLVRVFGRLPTHQARDTGLVFEDVAPIIKRCTLFDVKDAVWFNTYASHHRVAANFQQGRRLFLCGDAAHVHSPIGGQGLNAGVGDASNLAWKLAAVSAGKAAPKLLETYEPERIGFARTLVETTDSLFQIIAAHDLRGRIIRTLVQPYVVPFLWTWVPGLARKVFAIQSQTRIQYRDGPLGGDAKQRKTPVSAGDRMPYVENGKGYNLESMRERGWSVHIYGDVEEMVETLDVPVHGFALNEMAKGQKLEKDCMYLIRPDGHVATVAAKGDVKKIRDLLEKWGIEN